MLAVREFCLRWVWNKAWQLLNMLLRLTRDVFSLFVQQQANISIDAERRAGLSAIAELLVSSSGDNNDVQSLSWNTNVSAGQTPVAVIATFNAALLRGQSAGYRGVHELFMCRRSGRTARLKRANCSERTSRRLSARPGDQLVAFNMHYESALLDSRTKCGATVATIPSLMRNCQIAAAAAAASSRARRCRQVESSGRRTIASMLWRKPITGRVVRCAPSAKCDVSLRWTRNGYDSPTHTEHILKSESTLFDSFLFTSTCYGDEKNTRKKHYVHGSYQNSTRHSKRTKIWL